MKKLFPEIPVLNNGQIELRALTQADAEALEEMVNSRRVYRYLPTFLFEKKYPDVREVIRRLYTECLEESLILGVFSGDGSSFDTFCGLAEMYGYKENIHKISLGCRLAEHALGKGIATQAVSMMVDLLQQPCVPAHMWSQLLHDQIDLAVIHVDTDLLRKEQIIDHRIKASHRCLRLLVLHLGIVGGGCHIFIVTQFRGKCAECSSSHLRVLFILVVILIQRISQRRSLLQGFRGTLLKEACFLLRY